MLLLPSSICRVAVISWRHLKGVVTSEQHLQGCCYFLEAPQGCCYFLAASAGLLLFLASNGTASPEKSKKRQKEEADTGWKQQRKHGDRKYSAL